MQSKFTRILLGRMHRGTHSRSQLLGRALIFALILIMAIAPTMSAQSDQNEEAVEGLGSFRFPAITPLQSGADGDEISASGWFWTMPNVIVDTDTGVDDATALAWLFRQAGTRPSEIIGISTVAGNASVDDATENVLLLLAQTPIKFRYWPPVYRGAEGPLKRDLSSTGKLLHGVDGLGFVRNYAKLDPYTPWVDGYLPRIDSKAPAANDLYCDHVVEKHGPVTVVALGPLTNIATALDKCPNQMAQFRYVILGGARGTGNMTPSAEYNFWQDPEAADKVFNSGLDITVIPRELFDSFTLSVDDVDTMLRSYPYSPSDKWAGLADTVGSALCWFTGIQSADYSTGEANIIEWLPVPVPDPSALMYALNPGAYGGPEEDILLQIPVERGNKEPGLVRGESVIGFFSPYPEALTMKVSDDEISEIIDETLYDDLIDPYEAAGLIAQIYFEMASLQANISPNASIPSDLYSYRMQQDYLSTFSVSGRNQRECFPPMSAVSASGLGSTQFNQIVVPNSASMSGTGEKLFIPSISN